MHTSASESESESEFCVLTTCGGSFEGEMVRALLDAEGILCVVQGGHHVSVGGTHGLVKVRVLVVRRDLERALALLESSKTAEAAGLGEAPCAVHGEVSTAECVECGNFLCERCAFPRSRPLCEDCQQGKNSIPKNLTSKRTDTIAYTTAIVCLFLFLLALSWAGSM